MLNHFSSEEKAIDWLIKYALPVIGETKKLIKPDYKAPLKAFLKAKEEGAFDSVRVVKPLTDKEILSGYGLDTALVFVNGLIAQTFIRDIDLEPVEGSEITEPDMYEIYIESLFKKQIVPVWRGYGMSFCQFKDSWFDNEPEAFEFLATNAALKCLYSIGGFDDGPVDHGKGFDKIGLCSNCQKIFAKGRKDQAFCSDKCGKSVRMRKYRQKKKT